MPRQHTRRTRRELGQNLLSNGSVANAIVDDALNRHPDYPVVEFGPGQGALTLPVLARQRPVVAIERDHHLAAALPEDPLLNVIIGEAQRTSLPSEPFIVLGNLPFRGGTAILRSTLHHCERGFAGASLVFEEAFVQKRAGYYGGNLFNAQWEPWVAFHAGRTIPPHAFTPRPRCRGQLLHVHPRARPPVPPVDRKRYQEMVRRVFEGRGATIAQVLRADAGVRTNPRKAPIDATARAKDLTPHDWGRDSGPGGASSKTAGYACVVGRNATGLNTGLTRLNGSGGHRTGSRSRRNVGIAACTVLPAASPRR